MINLSAIADSAVSIRIRKKTSTGYGDYWDTINDIFTTAAPAARVLTQGTGDDDKFWTISLNPVSTYSGDLAVFYYVLGDVVAVQDLPVESGEEIEDRPFSGAPKASVIDRLIQNEAGQELLVYVTDDRGRAYTGNVTSTTIDLDEVGATATVALATPVAGATGWYRVTLTQAETNGERAVVTVTGSSGASGSSVVDFAPSPWVPTTTPTTPPGPKQYVKDLAGQEAYVYVQDANGVAYSGPISFSRISQDGGAEANTANPATAAGLLSPGWYRVPLTQSETNAEWASVKLTGTGGETGTAHIDFVPAAAAGSNPGENANPVSTLVVPEHRIWKLQPDAVGGTASNLIVVLPGFDDFVEMDFRRLLNAGDAIVSVTSAADLNAHLAAIEFLPTADRQRAHLRYSGFASENESTVRVIVATERGRTLVGQGTILVE